MSGAELRLGFEGAAEFERMIPASTARLLLLAEPVPDLAWLT